MGENDDSGGALSSRLAIDVVAGETYWISVDGNDFREDRSYGLAWLNAQVEEDPTWLTPVIENPGDTNAVAGKLISFQIEASRETSSFEAWDTRRSKHRFNTGVISGTPTQSGRYDIMIQATNEEGTGVFLYVLEIAPQAGSPSVEPLPIEVKGIEGAPIMIEVDVANASDAQYQWYKDGLMLSGEEAPALEILTLSAGDEGDYSVAVSNANGSVLAGPTRVRMIREALFNISTAAMWEL